MEARQTNQDNLAQLPLDIWKIIFSFFSHADLCRLVCINKAYNQLIKEEFIQQSENIDKSEASYSARFFKATEVSKWRIDEWYVKYNDQHILIHHPKLNTKLIGQGSEIDFGDLNGIEKFVSLPINLDQTHYHTIKESLASCDVTYMSDNLFEIVIKLPKEQSMLSQILKVIFNRYEMPQALTHFIENKLGLEPELRYELIEL